jgi:hypothetical protein
LASQPGYVEFTLRKVIFFKLVSLDGYFEGPDHVLEWHKEDAEFQEFSITGFI